MRPSRRDDPPTSLALRGVCRLAIVATLAVGLAIVARALASLVLGG